MAGFGFPKDLYFHEIITLDINILLYHYLYYGLTKIIYYLTSFGLYVTVYCSTR